MITLMQNVKVADECWIALALLHREHPERASFSAAQILDRLRAERAHPELRSGVPPHIYLHNVANLPPNSARYRLFYRLDDGTYRLYRSGDISHPDRAGKTRPAQEDLPDRYWSLLKWYETDYCAMQSRGLPSMDRLLAARGLGREIWVSEDGDQFVQELRSGWEEDGSHVGHETKTQPLRPQNEEVWERVKANAGKEFRTKEGLPFSYEVDGNSGLWFFRD
jgi:hypothetical protein